MMGKENRRHKLAISGIKDITTDPTDIKRLLGVTITKSQ